jgi:hypothetical protein
MNTIRRPAHVVRRSAEALANHGRARDAFRRETFALPREAARAKPREMFRRFPKAAYMTEIESSPGVTTTSNPIPPQWLLSSSVHRRLDHPNSELSQHFAKKTARHWPKPRWG